jgi:alkaline phosphatase D
MPLRPGQFPIGSDLRLYRRLAFGSLFDLNVLDTRQYRSNQACEGAKPGCSELGDDRRTMLGEVQERWLFDELGRAQSRWTVIGQQVPLFTRDLGPESTTGRVSTDKWDGYPAARDRLIARLVETRAPNPIVLSGDVHVHYGADLTRDVSRPESGAIGSEFTNTSASSGGDGAEVSANWKLIAPINPHIKYHSARRGYVACTVTPDTFRADFKVLDRVSVPGAVAKTGGILVVEAGKPGAVAG